MEVNSCYIHIPFCESICSYCDFCKMYYNSNLVDKYLLELEKEIDSRYKGEVLDTIYIGGGTPSCLSIRQLEKLFSIINKLKRSKSCEFTIEGNFSSTGFEKLDLYKKNGVNRLSSGVESINKNNLKFLDCACRFTEKSAKNEEESKRLMMKNLVKRMRKDNPNIDYNIYKALDNVNLNCVIGTKTDGEYESFLANYDNKSSE